MNKNNSPDPSLSNSLQSAIDAASGIPVDEQGTKRVIQRATQLAQSHASLSGDGISPRRENGGAVNGAGKKAAFRISPWWFVAASIAALCAIVFTGGSSSAFARMQIALDNIQTIQATSRVLDADGNELKIMRVWVDEPDLFRQENGNGGVMVLNLKVRKNMMLNTINKSGRIVPVYDADMARATMGQILEMLRCEGIEDDGEPVSRTIDGKEYVEYEFDAIGGGTGLVLIDPETSLPFKLTLPDPSGSCVEVSELKFDEPVDPALFAIEVPEGYDVDVTPRFEKVDDTALVLDKDVGLGPVEFGMSRDQVVEVLGNAEREVLLRDSAAAADSPAMRLMEFKSRGFSIHLTDERGVTDLNLHTADDTVSDGRDFEGALACGLKINCSPADVIRVLGEPDQRMGFTVQNPDGGFTYRNDRTKTYFSFLDGKAFFISVTLLPADDDFALTDNSSEGDSMERQSTEGESTERESTERESTERESTERESTERESTGSIESKSDAGGVGSRDRQN